MAIKGGLVPCPSGKKPKEPKGRSKKTEGKSLSFEKQEHLKMLDKAIAAEPDAFDSKLRGYYLGPTVGQVLSWYFGDHPEIFAKIEAKLKEGLPKEMVANAMNGEFPELRLLHVEYVIRVRQNDTRRREEYLKRVAEARADNIVKS